VYVAKAFPPEAKARALEMVNNIKSALREHIKTITWMDDSTKEAALKKPRCYVVKIGYPTNGGIIPKLAINRSSFVSDLRRASQLQWNAKIAKIGNRRQGPNGA